jgi:addiction module RelB/DinJ family antitoxin
MANVNVRVDDGLKRQTEYYLGRMGLTFSSAITMYFAQIVDKKAIPFPVGIDDDAPPPELARLLRKAKKESGAGETLNFASPEAAVDFLRDRAGD